VRAPEGKVAIIAGGGGGHEPYCAGIINAAFVQWFFNLENM